MNMEVFKALDIWYAILKYAYVGKILLIATSSKSV